jgi:hypothetical protein
MGIDFDEFIAFYGPPLYIDVGRAAWEARGSNLELGNHLGICLKVEENQESQYRCGRSPGFRDAHWVLASISEKESMWEIP